MSDYLSPMDVSVVSAELHEGERNRSRSWHNVFGKSKKEKGRVSGDAGDFPPDLPGSGAESPGETPKVPPRPSKTKKERKADKAAEVENEDKDQLVRVR